MLVIEADRSARLERVGRLGRSGQLRGRRRDHGDAARGRQVRDDLDRPGGRDARQGLRHRHLRPEGLPEPLRRPRRPRRGHGQQGPQGHRRLRQGHELARARRQGGVRRCHQEVLARRSKEHGSPGTGLPMYGTNVLTNILNEAGGLPTRNFSVGHLRVRRRDRRRDASATPSSRAAANVNAHGCHPAASSSARATGSTRTATTRPRVRSTRPPGRSAPTAASTTSTRSPSSTAPAATSASTPSRWAAPSRLHGLRRHRVRRCRGALAALKAGLRATRRVIWDGAEATGA